MMSYMIKIANMIVYVLIMVVIELVGCLGVEPSVSCFQNKRIAVFRAPEIYYSLIAAIANIISTIGIIGNSIQYIFSLVHGNLPKPYLTMRVHRIENTI